MKKKKKQNAKSTITRVSNLYAQDMKDIQRMLSKMGIDASLPATYNIIRPNILPVLRELQRRRIVQIKTYFKVTN